MTRAILYVILVYVIVGDETLVTFLDNVVLGVALTLPLGPVTFAILKNGLSRGFGDALKTAVGAFSAELTYFTIVFMGLSRFAENLIVKIGLGGLGVIFLIYLGYGCLKDFFIPSSSDAGKKYKSAFATGFLITFLNPSNFFMWAGIIGASFAQSGSLFVCAGVLPGVFMSLFAFVFISTLGKKIVTPKRMRFISFAAGLFLMFYGLRLLHNLIQMLR